MQNITHIMIGSWHWGLGEESKVGNISALGEQELETSSFFCKAH